MKWKHMCELQSIWTDDWTGRNPIPVKQASISMAMGLCPKNERMDGLNSPDTKPNQNVTD